MTVSNTKLSSEQKSILRNMKKEYPLVQFGYSVEGEVTIAYMLEGENVRFATSIASKDEAKIRRKVGEYNAMRRLVWDGENSLWPYNLFSDVLSTIENN